MVLNTLWTIVMVLIVIIIIVILLKLVFAIIAIGPIVVYQQQEDLHMIYNMLPQTLNR